MALTEVFIQTVCSKCPLRNNLDWADQKSSDDWATQLDVSTETVIQSQRENILDKITKIGSRALMLATDICGVCGCSQIGMLELGKACPLGLSGDNKGIYAKVAGTKPKAMH